MMTTDEPADRQLDDLLQQNYAALIKPDPLQRQAVLGGLGQPLRIESAAARRPSRLRVVSISAVVALFLGMAVLLTRWAPSNAAAYGIDGLSERLHRVQSITLRGWQWMRDTSGPNKPPLRAPFELLVKRPFMFRHSVVGLSVERGHTDLREYVHVCNGKDEWMSDKSGKLLFIRRSLNPLEARLKTESLAQTAAVTALLGPGGASFRKVGTDSANVRRCDVYEGRCPNGSRATVTKVWIDPQSGLPARVVRDELNAVGVLDDETDLTEIAVNSPLPDDLFRRQPSDGEQPSTPDKPHDGKEPSPLDASPVNSGSNGSTKLEAWYALQIADNAALVIWRRSRPPAKDNTTPGWLSDMRITIADPGGNRSANHAWLEESNSADRWSWSLVVPSDGKPLGPNGIEFSLNAGLGQVSLAFLALRFNDEELERLLTAARKSTLGQDAEPMSLADLRAQARELSNSQKTK